MAGRHGQHYAGTTILEAIQSTASPGTVVEYDKNGQLDGKAEACVAVVGERPYAEGQGDSADLALPVSDTRMLSQLPEHCEKIVVVLISGRPLIVTEHLDGWDALVAAWLPGTEGQGIADVLFGDQPFTGKLPYSWPRSMEQIPFDFANLSAEGCGAPLFPLGYGLDAASGGPLVLPECP